MHTVLVLEFNGARARSFEQDAKRKRMRES